MLIKEACRRCGLTKKAIQYYEHHGLISPEILGNGYRNYSEQHIADLKEIAVLRSCGIAVQHIQMIMTSSNKSDALIKIKHLHELKLRQLERLQANMEQLIHHYNIDDSFTRLQQQEEHLTLHEKLVTCFPGSLGLFLSLHFGRFLHHPIETKQQRNAYKALIHYLDNIPMLITDELHMYLETIMQAADYNQLPQLEDSMKANLDQALASPKQYFESESLQSYIAYRSSEAYKESNAGKLADLWKQFQQHSGYRDIFIPNLKVISPSYASYYAQLEALNEQFLTHYPEAEQW